MYQTVKCELDFLECGSDQGNHSEARSGKKTKQENPIPNKMETHLLIVRLI